LGAPGPGPGPNDDEFNWYVQFPQTPTEDGVFEIDPSPPSSPTVTTAGPSSTPSDITADRVMLQPLLNGSETFDDGPSGEDSAAISSANG
jgi:hypothetical protein